MTYQTREIRELKTKMYNALIKTNNTKSSIQILNSLHASCNFLNNLQHMKHSYYVCSR